MVNQGSIPWAQLIKSCEDLYSWVRRSQDAEWRTPKFESSAATICEVEL